MSNQNKVIERIKNIILVVLVLTTVLLLYFLWYDNPSKGFLFDKGGERAEIISAGSVILPKEVLISKGGIEFAVDMKERKTLWENSILPELFEASQSTSVAIEEISEEQHRKSEEYKSVIATFPYSIPLSDFCKSLGLKEWQGFEKIGGVSAISFSESSRESVFLTDTVNTKYYRIITNRKSNIVKELSKIAAKNKYQTFYKLNMLLGTQNKSRVFLPIDEPRSLPNMICEFDIADAEEREQDEMAELYFGNSFDFIRKIKENDGTLRYMYGYGKITLNIEPGLDYIEYKSEQEGGGTQTVYEALQTALDFAGQKKVFENSKGESQELHLVSISSIDNAQGDNLKKAGYRFEFAPDIGGYDIFYTEKPFLVIEVTGGQVSYIHRSLKSNFVPIQGKAEKTAKAIDIIVENHELLGKRLAEKGKTGKNFEDVTEEIQEIQYGYLCKGNTLIPVWKIGMGNELFVYLDPFTGEEVI